jgi:hypothetical protein
VLHSLSRRPGRWVPLEACLAVAIGCGPAETGGTVQGKITFKGAPVDLGSVLFIPRSGPTATANLEPDGTYKLLNPHKTEFIPPGKYLVVVVPGDKNKSRLPEDPATGDMPIPVEFTSSATSPLRADVVEGPNTIDMELNKSATTKPSRR